MERHNILVYNDKNENISIVYRNWTNGKPGLKQVEKFKYKDWYFTIKSEDLPRFMTLPGIKDLIRFTKKEGKRWIRVYCQNRDLGKSAYADPKDARTKIVKLCIEHDIPTYEADLSPAKRYIIDSGIEIGDKFTIGYFDIETDDRGEGIVIGRDQVISMAICDNVTDRVYYLDAKEAGGEKQLLERIIRRFEMYDVIVGWNSDGFDLPYIVARCKKYDIDTSGLRNVQTADMMIKFQETYGRDTKMVKEFRSYRLEDVGQYFLGYGKLPRVSTWEMFENDPARLKEYNIKDVTLLRDLEKKTGVIDLSILKAKTLYGRLREKTSGGALDLYILRYGNQRGEHFKTNLRAITGEDDDLTSNNYVGGHVFVPKTGIHKDVFTFDFSSLYPSLIRTFNISPETIIGPWDSGLVEYDDDKPWRQEREPEPLGENEIGCPAGWKYRRDKWGIIPELCEYWVNERNKIRKEIMTKLDPESFEYKNWDKKQYVFKVLANSIYGLLGAKFFRWYDPRLASSITLSGHYLIKNCSQFMLEQGFETIAGDTDSIMVAPIKKSDS